MGHFQCCIIIHIYGYFELKYRTFFDYNIIVLQYNKNILQLTNLLQIKPQVTNVSIKTNAE